MTKKKNNIFKSKFAIGLVFVIAVIYTVYHLISLFVSPDLKPIASGITEHNDTVGGRGYVFRDETLLSSDNMGVIDYQVGDGERISVLQPLADVYIGNEGLSSRTLMRSIDEYIDLLEKSEIGAEPVDLKTLRQDANDTYYTLVRMLNEGQAGELSLQIEQMMVVLNKISVLEGGQASVTETLASLRDTRASMLSGHCVTEYSQTSGYFYYYPDGYEEYFSTDVLDDMTPEYFYELEKYLLGSKSTVDTSVYGKIAQDSSWKFAISLPKKEAERLEVGSEYSVLFPENNNISLSMSLEKKIVSESNGEDICVFYCNKLPSDFDLDRAQSVQITVSTVRGIYVPRSALVKKDGLVGVYVLRGSVVYFRCIQIIYDGIDYCLAAIDGIDQGGYYALDTNEMMITNGRNLFDGRVLG